MTTRQARRLLEGLKTIGAQVPRWEDFKAAVRLAAKGDV